MFFTAASQTQLLSLTIKLFTILSNTVTLLFRVFWPCCEGDLNSEVPRGTFLYTILTLGYLLPNTYPLACATRVSQAYLRAFLWCGFSLRAAVKSSMARQ